MTKGNRRKRLVCPECRKRKEFTDKNFIRHNGEIKRFIGSRCWMDFRYDFTGTIHTWNDKKGETESDIRPLCRDCMRKIMGYMKW